MKSLVVTCVLVLGVCAVFSRAAPAPAPATLENADSAAIQPQNDKEVIEIVNLSNFGQSERDKRDITMLRQLFPGLADIFDRLIQEIISQTFRVVGRVLLQNGGLGALTGGGAGGGGGGRVSVSLPTFPPDDDEDEEEEDDEDTNTNNSSTSTTTDSNTPNAENNEDNFLSGSESQNSEVRVKYNEEDDQDTAASNNGPSPVDDSSADSDADRNKRFLPLPPPPHGGDHAAAGGSGNFLFDIIRLVAGSGSGSGASEAGDAAAHGPAVEVDVAKGADGYTEGVPGPITRLFVIANRGIANLIQDLILRLAQTSERIVNFKARLVTALI